MTKGTYSHSNRHRMHERNTDYHDRLEQEVTSLKREVILLETQNTNLTHEINGYRRQIHDLRLDNEKLRKSIAVLKDEPINYQ